MPTGIHAEEQENLPATRTIFKCLIESLISWVGRTPYFILQGLVDVVLRVRLNDKVPSLEYDQNPYAVVT